MSERTASAGVGSLLQQKAQPTSNGSRFASEKPKTRGVERVGLFYGPAITDELNERALITQRQQTAPANNEPVLFSVLTIATTPDAVETMKRQNKKNTNRLFQWHQSSETFSLSFDSGKLFQRRSSGSHKRTKLAVD